MDKGLVLKRFDGKLPINYINSVIKDFEMIREKIYLDGNPTEVVSQYLHSQSHINELNQQIKNIKLEIQRMENRMNEIKNHSVNQLRKDNRLLKWLNNLTQSELSILKEKVDIEREFKVIDDNRFRESKLNNSDKTIIRM